MGNRTAYTATTPLSGTLVTAYTYDAARRLTARAVSDGRTYTYTWSARGQLLAEWTQGYPVRTFTYDGAGRLVDATVFTLTTRFTYNGLGERVRVEVVGQGVTTVALDLAAGSRILAEETLTGTVRYLYGAECLGELRDGQWLYYLSDAEGLVRQGTDAEGDVVSAWLFDADGVVLEGPEGPVSHLVCGGVYDWSTGLIYRDGRYFDPNLGLWLALTPLVVVQSWRRRKGKGGWVWILSLALLAVGVSGMVTGCRPSTPMPTLCTEIPSPLPTPRPSPVPAPVPLPTPTLSGKIAYLTFDDQPNGLTPQVLEKLRFYGNIKATFNIVGQHLDWAGSYVNDIVREGHAVGLHSMNHVIPWYTDPSYDSPYEQLTELIERVTSYGAQPQVWRAPAGVFERELPAPYNQSLYRYGWDINPLDEMNNAGKPQVIYSIYQEEMEANADDSNIILLHGWTPEALDLIIPDLIQRGYQFGVLPRSGDPIGPVIWD